MKKIQLKKEMGQYITAAEYRFVKNSLDKRIPNKLNLIHEEQTKRPNNKRVAQD